MNDLERKTAVQEFAGQLAKREKPFAALLPPEVPWSRFKSVALQHIAAKPEILTWERGSVFRALSETARLGLLPHGIVPGVHIVAFKGRAVAVPDYRALIGLAANAGVLASIKAIPVYASDEFTYEEGLETTLRHKWDLDSVDRGALRGCYAVAKLASGEYQIAWLNEAQLIARAKQAGKGYLRGVWADGSEGDKLQMRLKTVVKVVLNLIPRNSEKAARLSRAMALDAVADTGDPDALADMMGDDAPSDAPDEPTTRDVVASVVGAKDPVPAEVEPKEVREPGDDGDEPPVDVPPASRKRGSSMFS